VTAAGQISALGTPTDERQSEDRGGGAGLVSAFAGGSGPFRALCWQL